MRPDGKVKAHRETQTQRGVGISIEASVHRDGGTFEVAAVMDALKTWGPVLHHGCDKRVWESELRRLETGLRSRELKGKRKRILVLHDGMALELNHIRVTNKADMRRIVRLVPVKGWREWRSTSVSKARPKATDEIDLFLDAFESEWLGLHNKPGASEGTSKGPASDMDSVEIDMPIGLDAAMDDEAYAPEVDVREMDTFLHEGKIWVVLRVGGGHAHCMYSIQK